MRTVFRSTLVAAGLAVVLGTIASAQGRQTVPVNIQPGESVDVLLFAAANAGKPLTTTDSNGKGSVDVTDYVNLGKLDVIEEKCDDGQTRVLLVAQGTQLPENRKCRRRKVGVFWPGHDRVLNVRLSTAGGVSTTTKVAIIGGAAAAGAIVAVKAGGSNSDNTPVPTPPVTTPPPTPTPPPPPTPPPTPNPTSFNGTYTGSLPATGNGCNFSPTAAIRGVLTVDATGHGTWVKTHLDANVTFTFNVTLSVTSPTAAGFTATTSQPVGSQSYNVQDQVSISGNTMSITQTFASLGTPICTVRYQGTLTKG